MNMYVPTKRTSEMSIGPSTSAPQSRVFVYFFFFVQCSRNRFDRNLIFIFDTVKSHKNSRNNNIVYLYVYARNTCAIIMYYTYIIRFRPAVKIIINKK